MPGSLYFYQKHHIIYSYNHLFSESVQTNCPDIYESKSQFPDKNYLFACLVSSISLHNYDQYTFQLVSSIRKAKLFVVLEGNGRNSSITPKNYEQTFSFSLQNYDQTSSITLQNYDQGVQDFELNRHLLLTWGNNSKNRKGGAVSS